MIHMTPHLPGEMVLFMVVGVASVPLVLLPDTRTGEITVCPVDL